MSLHDRYAVSTPAPSLPLSSRTTSQAHLPGKRSTVERGSSGCRLRGAEWLDVAGAVVVRQSSKRSCWFRFSQSLVPSSRIPVHSSWAEERCGSLHLRCPTKAPGPARSQSLVRLCPREATGAGQEAVAGSGMVAAAENRDPHNARATRERTSKTRSQRNPQREPALGRTRWNGSRCPVSRTREPPSSFVGWWGDDFQELVGGAALDSAISSIHVSKARVSGFRALGASCCFSRPGMVRLRSRSSMSAVS